MHYIFTVKGCTMPIAAFAVFGWCMANGGGLGALDLVSQEGTAAAATTPLGWSIMSGINTIFGSLSPMLVNQPDFARYTKKPSDAGIGQGISCFVSSVIIFFLGTAATTSMQAVYGEAYWVRRKLSSGQSRQANNLFNRTSGSFSKQSWTTTSTLALAQASSSRLLLFSLECGPPTSPQTARLSEPI